MNSEFTAFFHSCYFNYTLRRNPNRAKAPIIKKPNVAGSGTATVELSVTEIFADADSSKSIKIKSDILIKDSLIVLSAIVP